MVKKFTKKVENFVCEQCGTAVTGNGYTNHCPQCLWSKHVDENPGDRAATCKGLMKPIELKKNGERYVIKHACVKCSHTRTNKSVPEDNFNTLIALSQSIETK